MARASRYILPLLVALISISFMPAVLGGWPWPRLILPIALLFTLEGNWSDAWLWAIIGGGVFDLASGGHSSWLLLFGALVALGGLLNTRFGIHIDSLLGVATFCGLLLLAFLVEALMSRAGFGWQWLWMMVGYVSGALISAAALWLARFSRSYHSRTKIQFM